jgi:hypothetical protein
MSDDFYTGPVKVETIVDPRSEGALFVNDPTTRRLLYDILRELKCIHYHLAGMTDQEPDTIRRDIE